MQRSPYSIKSGKVKGPMAGWAPDSKMQKKMLEWEKAGEVSSEKELVEKQVKAEITKKQLETRQKVDQEKAKRSMNETIAKVREYKERMKMKRKMRGKGILKGIGKMSAFRGPKAPTLIGGKRFEGGSTRKA